MKRKTQSSYLHLIVGAVQSDGRAGTLALIIQFGILAETCAGVEFRGQFIGTCREFIGNFLRSSPLDDLRGRMHNLQLDLGVFGFFRVERRWRSNIVLNT